MNKNLKLMVLVGLGGAGLYLIWKGKYLEQWLPDIFGPKDAASIAAAARAKADAAMAAAAADPTNAAAMAAAEAAKSEASAAAARANAASTVQCPQDSQLCWDGSYVERVGPDCHFAPCPDKPAPATGLTPEQIAAQGAQAARTQLYNRLVATGVDPSTAQTYIDHCGANGQCDSAFLNQMYQQAALGVPEMMKLTDVGGILFNADQWQYYRAAGGGGDLDVGAVFTVRTRPIHASEFNAALNKFSGGDGMSGFQGLGWLA